MYTWYAWDLLGPSISSTIAKSMAYSGLSYASSPVFWFVLKIKLIKEICFSQRRNGEEKCDFPIILKKDGNLPELPSL